MTSHQTVVLSAAIALLVLAGGCASHPPKPAAHPTAEARPAHLFRGCKVLVFPGADADYDVQCQTLVATVKILPPGPTPAQVTKRFVEGMRQASQGSHWVVVARPMKDPLEIAGQRRKATVVAVLPNPKAKSFRFLGLVSAWSEADGKITMVSCGAAREADGNRCPELLDWMATHPTPPAGVPQQTATAATAEAPAPAWIPPAAFKAPMGCKRVLADARHLRIQCLVSDLVLTRLRDLDGPPSPEATTPLLDALAGKVLAKARGQHLTEDTKVVHEPCRVGADPGTCARVHLLMQGHKVAVILGVGRLFHALASVECLTPDGGAGLPPVCAQVMHLRRSAARHRPDPSTRRRTP